MAATSEVIGQASGVSDLLWIEKIKLVAAKDRAPAGLPPELAALLAEAINDPDCIRAVAAAVAPLVSKLPSDIGDLELTPLLAVARSGDGTALVTAVRPRPPSRGPGIGRAPSLRTPSPVWHPGRER